MFHLCIVFFEVKHESKMHKNYLLSTHKRKELDQLNEHMRKFPSCKFVTKDVTSWKARRDDGEKSPR